ncbi:hypothetical protein [Nocardioides sp.]|uniref:hypothetical protein n=1 Tax=Nocardioides sp. TaxID=35761 RepID=UPI0035273653
MTAVDELRRRVEAAVDGTPYTLTATDDGFDLAVDWGDQRWFALLGKAGVSRTFIHHVHVDEGNGTFSVTDDSREVRWSAGVPTLALGAERMQGRVITLGRQRVWGLDDAGHLTRQADLAFDSEEGRELITTAAEGLDLRQRRGAAERTGLAFALVGGVGALVVAVVLLVAFALGKFS